MKDTVEPRSLKSIFAIGIATGFFYASGMALFDYLDGSTFHIYKFLFHFIFFGFFMAIAFRKKVTKK
ncbi:MAG: hypothetical protein ABF247_08930 [Nonlabens sp.]|uniref:hypothetical protein n=1 Tax=Nonlabens sp. TaxID=1888209 RepID=UPI00321B2234